MSAELAVFAAAGVVVTAFVLVAMWDTSIGPTDRRTLARVTLLSPLLAPFGLPLAILILVGWGAFHMCVLAARCWRIAFPVKRIPDPGCDHRGPYR